MSDAIHHFSQSLKDWTDILASFHVLALIIVNITKSPNADRDLVSYTALTRLYRAIEILAGLVTPLSKR